jgi:hypothetical protein
MKKAAVSSILVAVMLLTDPLGDRRESTQGRKLKGAQGIAGKD